MAIDDLEKLVDKLVDTGFSRCVAAGVLARFPKPEHLVDKLVETVLYHEAQVRIEQQAVEASTQEMVVETAGVQGSLSKPDQLVDKLVQTVLHHEAKVRMEQEQLVDNLVDVVLDHKAKVRSEQQTPEASTCEMVIE